MLLYFITDRTQLQGSIVDFVESAARAGVDWVQIREKDLPGTALYELVRECALRISSTPTRLLVNGRPDIALAAGAHGVHLPSDSLSPASVRKVAPRGFLVGVSCHDLAEVQRSEGDGADFAVFGPVFDTPSKRRFGSPVGVSELRRACACIRLPVLALGGVTVENASTCMNAGASGIAGIGIFQAPTSLESTVRELRALGETGSVAE